MGVYLPLFLLFIVFPHSLNRESNYFQKIQTEYFASYLSEITGYSRYYGFLRLALPPAFFASSVLVARSFYKIFFRVNLHMYLFLLVSNLQ